MNNGSPLTAAEQAEINKEWANLETWLQEQEQLERDEEQARGEWAVKTGNFTVGSE